MKDPSTVVGPVRRRADPARQRRRPTGRSSSASSSAPRRATSTGSRTRPRVIAGYASRTTSRSATFQLERGGQWDKGKSLRDVQPARARGWSPPTRSPTRSSSACGSGSTARPAERHDQQHDLPGARGHPVPEPVHGPRPRRRDQHRHAGGCRPRHAAARPTCGPATWSSSASTASVRSGSPSSRPRELPPRSEAERLAGVGRGLLALLTRR